MNPVALFGAFFGGVVGAVIWGLITHFTGYELGYVAWAVGGIVGYGAVALDGHGVGMATWCAVICLASIFCGKIGGMYAGRGEAKDEMAAMLTDENYGEMIAESQAFSMLPSEDYYKDFMVENLYTATQSVSEEELARFTAVEVPMFRQLFNEKIGIETWRESYVERYMEYTFTKSSLVDLVVSELDAMDMIFAILGVITAISMVLNAGAATRHKTPQTTNTV